MDFSTARKVGRWKLASMQQLPDLQSLSESMTDKMAARASFMFHLAVGAYYFAWDYYLLSSVLPTIFSSFPIIRQSVLFLSVQFATVWVLLLHNVYFICCLSEHVLNAMSPLQTRDKLKHFTDTLFTRLVWPITIVVSANFWLIFALDRRLLDPFDALFGYISRPANHVMHTNVMPIALVELCTRRHATFPVDVLRSAQSQAKVLGFYFLILAALQPFTPMWIYPYFQKLGPVHWVLYFAANVVLSVVAQVGGKALSHRLWASSSGRHRNVGTKKKLLLKD